MRQVHGPHICVNSRRRDLIDGGGGGLHEGVEGVAVEHVEVALAVAVGGLNREVGGCRGGRLGRNTTRREDRHVGGLGERRGGGRAGAGGPTSRGGGGAHGRNDTRGSLLGDGSLLERNAGLLRHMLLGLPRLALEHRDHGVQVEAGRLNRRHGIEVLRPRGEARA